MHRTTSSTLVFLIAAIAPFTAAAASRQQTYEELTGTADRVLLGTVGARSSHWGNDSRIYTDVVVYPEITIKGAEEGPAVVEFAGGTVGDTTMSVSDGPELPEGERVVIFLNRESNHFVVAGRSAGSVASSALQAADALNGAFTFMERTTGRRLAAARALAGSYLDRGGLNRGGIASPSRTSTTAKAQVGCYGTDGAKWGTSSATYQIGPSIPPGWGASIDAATSTWNNAGAAFHLVNDPASSNQLSYLDLVAKYGSSYSNTFAVTTTWSSTSTGLISKATIEVNNSWSWSTQGDANSADVQNILTHEFGHWMRLLDIYSPSTCSEVTMWGSASFGETKKRTLEQPDIDGFLSLYAGASTAPGAPVLTSPSNGATGVPATPTLSWTASTNATSYDVYFGATSSPAFVTTVTGTSYQPGTLTAGTTYYWRVAAKNAGGSATSGTFSFTVAPGGATSGPTLLAPANGATGVSLSPVMQWSAVQGTTAYDLYIGTSASSLSRIGSVNTTSVTVRGFRSGTVYYWKVVARTPSGSLSSSVASFRTN